MSHFIHLLEQAAMSLIILKTIFIIKYTDVEMYSYAQQYQKYSSDYQAVKIQRHLFSIDQ